jgi:transposase-like protein
MPNKDTLVELYYNQHKTLKEIGEQFGVSIPAVHKWFKKYNLFVIKHRDDINKPTKEELLKLYETTEFTIKSLAKKYGVGEKTMNRWFKDYSIKPIRSVERKYYHLRQVPLTKKQKEFIIGSLLGDGHIDNSKTKRFVVNHCEKQMSYLEYKKDILNNYVNKLRKNAKQKSRNSTTYNLTTIGHNEFNILHRLFYNNTKKVIKDELCNYFTPYIMAIWFMDDGSSRKYDMKISTEGFTKKENEKLRDMIYVNFGISCKVCEYNNRDKKYYYLSFNKKNSIKLCELIKPYIIPSMMYKLLRSSTTDTPSSSKIEDDDTV